MYRRIIISLVVIMAAVPAFAGPAEDAEKAFVDGGALLAQGDFHGALEAYRQATANDTQRSQGYHKQWSMLSQVIRLRMKIEQEQDPDRWDQMAAAMRSFYQDNALHSESLPLDREYHKRHGGSESATALAETQLALGLNSEVVNTLTALEDTQATPRTDLLLGLALASQGQIEQARELATAAAKTGTGSQFLYDLACLRARVGDSKGAFDALTRSFEQTPASRLASLKADASTSSDFADFANVPAFASALATESKVKASGCGGNCKCSKKSGSGCNHAKSSTPCAHGKDAKTDAGKTPCGHSKEAKASAAGKTPCGHSKTERE